MLKFYYESGNDEVAVSQKKMNSKIMEYIKLYDENKKNNEYFISQLDMVNVIGNKIFEGHIDYKEVCVIIDELNEIFLFDKEGSLTEDWYSIVPEIFY